MKKGAVEAVTLWIPGLLNKLRVQEAQEALQTLQLPALQSILAKADRFNAKPQNFYQQASYLFHQPDCLPIAATKACQELTEFDKSQFWLSVDPVQMIPDRDSLVLISAKSLAITDEESKALIASFNAHFAEDRVELIWAKADSWYLSIVQPVDIQTTTLEEVDHKPVNQFYPQGNAAQYWRQLINETQMLFYTHPVNEARRAKGWPEINSVWAWGEGKIDASKLMSREDSVIWSSDSYLQGMALLTNAVNKLAPSTYQAWSNAAGNAEIENKTKHLIHLDWASNRLDDLQLEEWVELLQQLEQDWFAPLLEATYAGEIESLLIDLGCEYRCHLKSSHKRRFWRRKKALHRI